MTSLQLFGLVVGLLVIAAVLVLGVRAWRKRRQQAAVPAPVARPLFDSSGGPGEERGG